MDDVCVTNINRQIHAMTGTVGQSKIEVMAQRIALINPECKVNLIDDFITPENLAEYIGPQFDYVLDAIDSMKPKAALLAYCKRHKIKVITTGGAGGQTYPTQIQIANLTKTIQIRWRKSYVIHYVVFIISAKLVSLVLSVCFQLSN